MQAVILAAGKSKRFYPLCDKTNKTMISLLGKTILEWTILALEKMGIKDIILVINPEGAAMFPPLRCERKPKIVIQEEAVGMADGLLCAKGLIKDDFLLLNGYHLDADNFINQLIKRKIEADAVLLAEERENPWEYGVLDARGGQAYGLVEKPQKGKEAGKICVAGIYLFGKDFLPFLEKFKPSHYQFEEAINKYCQEKNVVVEMAKTQPLSLKYSWDLFKIKDYLLKKLPGKMGKKVKMGKGAQIIGKVIVEDGVEIFENAVIKGPVYLGKNAVVGNGAVVRAGSVIEENCVIGAFSEIKNSLFLPGTHFGGAGFVGSSIIGENCRLGHGFTTANKRFDRKNIGETGLNDLGVLMGENVNCGINVGVMPGKIIGSGATIGPGTIVMEDVPAGEKYYVRNFCHC